MIGHRIATYDITARLGEGGMGEVYRARDTKLGREVALKILPPAFADDHDRLARFQREARVLASLNHPHIAAIHGLEDADGVRALVLELVEGPTLAERLQRGPLPLAEATAVARQIADALEAAHEQGIVHRDLKPANVKVTPAGTVKVLDFGLAKALQPVTGADEAAAPTATALGTRVGVVLGTPAYMSPEQARGQVVDKRADIWAFGCVVYELLTGRRAFAGRTAQDTLAAVFEREPDWTTLPADTPEGMRRVLARCLQKDPRRRLHAIADARIELDEAIAAPAIAAVPRARLRRHYAGLAGVIVVTAAVALGYAAVRPSPLETSGFRYTPFATEPDFEGYPAWSPDGRSLAYLADVDGERHILVRSLDAAGPTQVTTSAHNPSHLFWSHDSARIYYSRGNAIWSVSVAGGEPRLLLEDARIAAMSPDGRTLAFLRGPGGNSSLWFTPTEELAPEHYLTPPFPETFTFSVSLDFSRDGSKVAVLVEPRDRAAFETELWVVPVPSGEPRRVLDRVPSGIDARVSWAADNRHVVLTGSDARTGGGGRHLHLADTDRRTIQRLTSGVLEAVAPSVSPDGERIAFTSGADDGDLVQIALDGSGVRPLLASARDERDPSWSPDGSRIAYATDARGTREIWLRSLREGWSAPLVTRDTAGTGEWQNVAKPAFSPDGQRVAYGIVGVTHEIWVSPVSGGQGVPLDQESPDQHGPTWSPDGQWIAYQRLREGTWGLVKMPLSGGAAIRLAGANAGGAPEPAWSPAGEWIAQTYGSTLRLVSTDGEIVKDLGPRSPAFGFSRDGSLLHALRRPPGGGWELVTYEVSSRVERGRLALDIPRSATVAGFSLHPDGRSFATSIVMARYDIWLLEGFKPPAPSFLERFWRREISR